MARFQVIVTSMAHRDFFEIVESRFDFDPASASLLGAQIFERAQALTDFPFLYRVVLKRRGKQYRRMVVKSCTVLYRVEVDRVVIVRVFGPGRIWPEGSALLE